MTPIKYIIINFYLISNSMTTQISNETELKAWDGTTNAVITQNITITNNTDLPIDMGKTDADISLNGQKYIITINTTSFVGLVVPISNAQKITIQQIKIIYGASASMGTNSGSIVGSMHETQAGTHRHGFTMIINNCGVEDSSETSDGFIIPSNCGGIVGSFHQDTSSVANVNCTITGCYCTGTISGDWSGGIIGVRGGYIWK